MTAPIQPQGGPQSLMDWITYLHNAAQTPKDSPDYGEARDAMGLALRKIHALNTAATQAEANRDATGKPIGRAAATGVGLMQGLSLGTGEPLAGFLSAIQGQGFREGAARYREGLGNVQAQHPVLSAGGEVAGLLGLPAGTVGSGIAGTVKAGVPLTLGQGAGLLARGTAAGAIPGALAGFSAGGDDPGDIPARLESAKTGAEFGGLLGLLGTAAGARVARGHVERAADLADKGIRRAANRERLDFFRSRTAKSAPQPTDLRSQLLAAGVHPENIEAQLARQARGPVLVQPSSVADPLDIPAFQRRATPTPIPPAWQETVPRPGGVGGHSYSGTYPRPDPPPIITGAAEAAARIRQLPTAQVVEAFRNPNAPQALKELLRQELQRRRIAIPDLGIVPSLLTP